MDMRKIMTQEEKEKKETRNKIVLGLILIGIMVLSTAGYSFFSRDKTDTKKMNYKGINFVLEEDGLWHFEIQKQEFITIYNPEETENVSDIINLNLNNYAGNPLYFSYDSDNEGIGEIVRNIGRYIERVQKACLDECEEDFPVKNCTDNIIIIREVNESLIKQEDNCIYILFRGNEATRVSDAFIFKILGL